MDRINTEKTIARDLPRRLRRHPLHWVEGEYSRLSVVLVVAVLFLVMMLPATAFAKVKVVASLPDLAAVSKAVGGERVDVVALANPSVDPHYVDPRPNLILHLNKADLLVVNGLGLEAAWLEPLVKQARNPKLSGDGRLVAAAHAKLIEVPKTVDRSEGDIHPGGNPHFYFDPTSMIAVANAVRDRLISIDPKGEEAYTANAKTFTGELWKVAKKHALLFARLPEADRQVVSYHKSLGYVYRWLQLTEVATIEPKPGIPPNPKHVASVLSTMKTKKVDVIVQEEFYPQKTSKTLAKLSKAEVVVLAGGTKVDDGESYIERVNQVAEALYEVISK